MGLFDGIFGAVLGTAGSVIGNAIQNHQARKAASEQYVKNLEMMRENNAFNAAEAEKSREWMSYSNQRKLMEEAGLNPALMFSDGNTSASSAQATSSGSVPASVPQLVNPLEGISFSDIANGLKSLAEAKKIGGVDTRLTEEEINNTILEGRALEISNAYASKLSDQQLKEGAARIKKIYQECENLVKDGKLSDAQTALAKANELVANETKRLTGAQADYHRELADNAREYIESQIRATNATAQYNETNASLLPYNAVTNRISANSQKLTAETNREVGKSQIELNRSVKTLNDINAGIQALDFQTKDRNKLIHTINDFVRSLNEAKREVIMTDAQLNELGIIKQRLQVAVKENDTYMIRLLTGQASSVINTAATTLKAAK